MELYLACCLKYTMFKLLVFFGGREGHMGEPMLVWFQIFRVESKTGIF